MEIGTNRTGGAGFEARQLYAYVRSVAFIPVVDGCKRTMAGHITERSATYFYPSHWVDSNEGKIDSYSSPGQESYGICMEHIFETPTI